ncbi:hypothetical protein [Phytohabitans suffuscus]|uniref:hypothetical protein n=1 Tax=Phytohabitans suffuscus TaxID=624315 RepID=UPI0015662A43|nr:hypothetical protein [Phytohabitans suffuscus]
MTVELDRREIGDFQVGGLRGLSWPLFVVTYLALYAIFLGIGALAGFLIGSPDPSVEGFVVEGVLAAWFVVPFRLLPFAVALTLLYPLHKLRPLWFRVAAVVLCCLPLTCVFEVRQLTYYLPINVLVALIMQQPDDPSRHVVGSHFPGMDPPVASHDPANAGRHG